MASRRMFSKRVISSARFMKLTKDAQVLYFHLCLNADDDGAVEGFPVRRSLGIEEDAYINLEGRGFVRVLDRENEVLYITDWYEHNKLRADRIQPSMYRDLIERTVSDVVLIEPKKRSDLKESRESAGQRHDGPATDGQRTDDGQTTDGHMSDNGRSADGPRTDNGRSMDRLGEVRLGEVRTVQESEGEDREEKKDNGAKAPSNRKRFSAPTIDEIRAYCDEKGYTLTDPEYFWNYYENIGWHIGKNRMKNWKLAVSNWEKRQREFHASKGDAPRSKQDIMTRTPEEQAAQPKWGLFDD